MKEFIIFFACAFLVSIAPARAVSGENPLPVESSHNLELKRQAACEDAIERLRREHELFPLDRKLKRALAEAHADYGFRLIKQKQYETADANFVRAIELYPDDAGYAELRGVCNYHLKRYDVARYELERTRKARPDSLEALHFLGLTLYATENRKEAIGLWEHALKLAPGHQAVSAALAKARKESAVESGMEAGYSSRFDLIYAPGVDTSFALAVLDVLEEAFNGAGQELGYFPEARVPVIIYRRSGFKAVTDAPDWSGGVYDGKIRVPFGAMMEMTPVMRGILFHEYAHSAVYGITRGNCPVWLNEGIAEIFGRRQYQRSMPDPGKSADAVLSADFRKLEKGFGNLQADEAARAYQQSYELVNYMVTTYGWHRVNQILSGLGKGMTIDEAMNVAFSDFGLGYDGIVKEWRLKAGTRDWGLGTGDRENLVRSGRGF